MCTSSAYIPIPQGLVHHGLAVARQKLAVLIVVRDLRDDEQQEAPAAGRAFVDVTDPPGGRDAIAGAHRLKELILVAAADQARRRQGEVPGVPDVAVVIRLAMVVLIGLADEGGW